MPISGRAPRPGELVEERGLIVSGDAGPVIAQPEADYIMAGFDRYDELIAQLGKYKTGKSCLYVKRLSDIDHDVLKQLIAGSAEHVARSNA